MNGLDQIDGSIEAAVDVWVDPRPAAEAAGGAAVRWDGTRPMPVLRDEGEACEFIRGIRRELVALGLGSARRVGVLDDGLTPRLARTAYLIGLAGWDVVLWPGGGRAIGGMATRDQAVRRPQGAGPGPVAADGQAAARSPIAAGGAVLSERDAGPPTAAGARQAEAGADPAELRPWRREWLLLQAEAEALARAGRLFDVRSAEEFDGTAHAPCCSGGGRIPGARHAPLEWFLDPAVFRTPERLLSRLGLTASEGAPVGVYCHSGARSAVAFFVLRALGVPARNYLGSMHEWLQLNEAAVFVV
ncbi:rhodanese-like domain-containing protein [Hydrogenibacillus schlegelii]|uniref:thiosulfate sulfurtransferase n=4 Tax=Hydrogenibacillus schlegelii TaxID=1484 RepID=A0A179IPK8_HYDSH|nr:rhodanese-like domain-containing protein [Hydrogenibacillus schlegelii]OAR04608.1 hypothetical protein SA87_08695 [Hydrogenibacillus schlegelii]PTQ54826.1 MAG: Thiosulfate sulfurtransferase, rhodanese [Hydrogenibacillus schlegelii]